MVNPHFLLVTFPTQGHINPTLQFAKRLLRIGTCVTWATSVSAHRRFSKNSTLPDGLSFTTFSDGYDDGFNFDNNVLDYMSELKRLGSQALTELIATNENKGCPFTCVVYTLLLPWVAELAREFHVPSALLWIQPATVLDIYYYYFYGYGDAITKNINDPSYLIELPGLPPLTRRDLPSFFVVSNVYKEALPSFQEQLKALTEETNPKILVNTFDALESGALKSIENFKMIGIGPLVPSAFLDGKDGKDNSFPNSKDDYMEWLNLKPKKTVIYVSFGTISVLSKPQMEEIARGLLDSGRPFLWVIRGNENKEEEKEKKEVGLSCSKELEEKGMIVPWCSQVEVLSHEAIGCFVSHCGWNSTLESLISGVPVVAFPQWTDQGTNAKLIEDVWKIGVRVNLNEEGMVEGGEIRRCLDLVTADEERGEELRGNAKKWKDLARDALKEGGTSDKNLKAFVDQVGESCHYTRRFPKSN